MGAVQKWRFPISTSRHGFDSLLSRMYLLLILIYGIASINALKKLNDKTAETPFYRILEFRKGSECSAVWVSFFVFMSDIIHS